MDELIDRYDRRRIGAGPELLIGVVLLVNQVHVVQGQPGGGGRRLGVAIHVGVVGLDRPAPLHSRQRLAVGGGAEAETVDVGRRMGRIPGGRAVPGLIGIGEIAVEE